MSETKTTSNVQDSRLSAVRPASRFRVRMESVKRIGLVYGLSRSLGIYVVTEYPKSGGTWFCQMLSTYLDLPFARNNNRQVIGKSILHGVYRYHSRIANPVAVIRDGRDIAVSAYFHFLHHNETNLASAVEEKRRYLGFKDYDDIRTNLPRFIEYLFVDHAKPKRRCSWTSFLDSWKDRKASFVRYEELLSDCAGAMRRVVTELTGESIDEEKLAKVIDRYSWRTLAGRDPGQEKKGTFMRKGIAGDWKNQFSLEAAQMFDQLAGETLVQWDYEQDRDWVDRFATHLQSNSTNA